VRFKSINGTKGGGNTVKSLVLRWENTKLSISSPQAKHKGEAELENVWLKTIALKDRTTKWQD
jgi:hypothetical protein